MKTKEQKLNRKIALQKLSVLVMGSIIAAVIILHLFHDGIGSFLNMIPLILK